MDEHVKELLEAMKLGEEYEDSLKLVKIERAICVYVLNTDREKAEKKLSQFSKVSSDLLEDILENRDTTAVFAEHGKDKQVYKNIEKDEEYKNICDMFMEKQKIYECYVRDM